MKKIKARKQHECEASLFFFENISLRDLICHTEKWTFAEKRIIIANYDLRVIKKGETYIRKVIKDEDGKRFIFRAKENIHEICVKYDIYAKYT